VLSYTCGPTSAKDELTEQEATHPHEKERTFRHQMYSTIDSRPPASANSQVFRNIRDIVAPTEELDG
jgi:hypothetical protein